MKLNYSILFPYLNIQIIKLNYNKNISVINFKKNFKNKIHV